MDDDVVCICTLSLIVYSLPHCRSAPTFVELHLQRVNLNKFACLTDFWAGHCGCLCFWPDAMFRSCCFWDENTVEALIILSLQVKLSEKWNLVIGALWLHQTHSFSKLFLYCVNKALCFSLYILCIFNVVLVLASEDLREVSGKLNDICKCIRCFIKLKKNYIMLFNGLSVRVRLTLLTWF